ncbi:MAG: hypothetical protein ABFC90_09835, partial [Bacteroidales bacterium]|nr:hypothetical protein [Bacteroidales bacterium]
TEGERHGRRRLRRTGAVDTKSPAKQNIEGSKKRNFCAGVEWTQTWTSGGGGYAAARKKRYPFCQYSTTL